MDGIDVLVVHPSPVTSNFYNAAHKLDALEMFRKTGTTPATIADAMLRSIGRTSVCDQGYYSFSVRVLLKVRELSLTPSVSLSSYPCRLPVTFDCLWALLAACGRDVHG